MSAHDHHHDHPHGDHHDHHHGSGSLGIAFALNLAFAAIELVGGIVTNSVAILSDAVHDFGDAATLAVAWALERVAGKKRRGRLTYGFRRYSLLGAFISGVILLGGSIGILFEAIPRLFDPEPVDPIGMMLLALLGLIFNGAAVFRLKKQESANSRLVMLHLMEDLLGWAAVLVGSVAIYFFGINILDPILSVAVTIFIMAKAIPRLLEVGRIFLQYAPPETDVEEISRRVTAHPEVQEVHDLHLWSLDGRYTLLTAHVVVSTGESITLEEIERIRGELKSRLHELGIDHATLEFEGSASGCSGCDL